MHRPIGIFDSGFGGLTVARAVIDLLPNEEVVYIGDTGRYPYGSKPLAEVREYARELAVSLVRDFDVKALIVACNTATAAGLDDLRAEITVPVIDVIEPGAQAVVQATSSGAYVEAVARTGAPVRLVSAACPGFVEFVERGQTTGDEVTVLAERLLAPISQGNVDALLLGCTHYPFLARTIGDVMGPDVTLVSSADETAFAAKDRLTEANLLNPSTNPGRSRFYSSGDIESFRELGERLLGPELDRTERWPTTTRCPDPNRNPEPNKNVETK
jgi:glutamate racemase